MRVNILYFLIFVIQFSNSFAQKKDSLGKLSLPYNSVDYDTTSLIGGYKLYYQMNQDSVWLTIETKNGIKKTISSLESKLAGYNYRLGYQLVKDFQNFSLFRYACPANGPCMHGLIRKKSAKQILKLNELIYSGKDIDYPLVAYFNEDGNQIVIHNLINGKKIYISAKKERFTYAIPEQQFTGHEIVGMELKLFYRYKNKNQLTKEDTLSVNVSTLIQ